MATEAREARLIVETAFELAKKIGVNTVCLQADELSDVRLIERLRPTRRLIWIARDQRFKPPTNLDIDQKILFIPGVGLSRTSQVEIGLFLATLRGYIERDETVLCVTGLAGSERFDSVFIANVSRDYPWFKHLRDKNDKSVFTSRALIRVIEIALRLAAEGREGHPIGTTFVLGKDTELRGHTRQLVLNPFEGHPRERRSIYDDEIFETIREFSMLDGAFIVNLHGRFVSAGTFLEAQVKAVKLRSGLGARHTAAAAISAQTSSVAVVLSSSSRNVMAFHEGRTLFELEQN
jgi:diadenylate cyclase